MEQQLLDTLSTLKTSTESMAALMQNLDARLQKVELDKKDDKQKEMDEDEEEDFSGINWGSVLRSVAAQPSTSDAIVMGNLFANAPPWVN